MNMMNDIARKVWNEIRWVSVTDKDLENLISFHTDNPENINMVKERVLELSRKEC